MPALSLGNTNEGLVHPDMPKGGNSEDELSAIDKEIDRYSQLHTDLGTRDLGQVLNEYGDQGLVQSHQNFRNQLNNSGVPLSDDQKYQMYGQYAGQQETNLRTMAEDKVRELQKKKASIGESAIADLMKTAAAKEAEIRSKIPAFLQTQGSAIDSLLQQKLGGITEQGNEARMQVGGNLADRGMSRSTVGSNVLGQTILAEQQDKASARTEALGMKQQAQRAADETTRQLDSNRRNLTAQKSLADVRQAHDAVFDLDQTSLIDKTNQTIEQMQLDAQSHSFMGGLLGGIVKGAASIFSGGLLGK